MARYAYSDSEAEEAVAATPIQVIRTDSFRLCELIDPRPDVDSKWSTAAEQLIAFQLLGHPRRPTDDDIVEAHLTHVFTRKIDGRKDRYSENTATLYSSLEERTAQAEMRYYSREEFYKPSVGIRCFTFWVIGVRFQGRVRDIRDVCRANRTLRAGTDLKFSRKIAGLALKGSDAVIVPSVRYEGGNQATISRSTVSSGGIWGKIEVEVFVRSSGRYTRVRSPSLSAA